MRSFGRGYATKEAGISAKGERGKCSRVLNIDTILTIISIFTTTTSLVWCEEREITQKNIETIDSTHTIHR